MPMVRALFFVILSLLIAGCGGAGEDKVSIAISATKADFQLTQDSSLQEPVLVNVEFSGESFLVGYPAGISDPGWLQIDVLSNNNNKALVKISFTNNRDVGKYSTTVRFVTGNPGGYNITYVDLPVTAEVHPKFTATAPDMVFKQVVSAEHLTMPKTGYAINMQGSRAKWTVTSNVDWISFDKTSGSGAGTVNVRVLKNAGDGYGTITVRDSQSFQSQQIPVRVVYQQNIARFNPESLEFSVNATTSLAELLKNLDVTDSLSSAAPELGVNWSFKEASVPWLKVDKIQGNTAESQKLQVSVDSAVTSLPTGTVNEKLVFSYTTNDQVSHEVEIPVKFTSSLPSVQVVAPYIIEPNVPGTLTVRGYGFDQLSANSKIKIGESSYPIKSLQSDTQLKIDHPALGAGRYPVSLEISSQLPLQTATLVVQESEALPDYTIPAPGVRPVLAYDPERKRIYTFNLMNAEFEVYSYQQGSWAKIYSHSFGLPQDLKLTKDGKQLIAVIGAELWTIDVTKDNFPAKKLLDLLRDYSGSFYFKNVVTLNDNKVALSSTNYNCLGCSNVIIYDLNFKKFFGNYSAYSPAVAASGDGSRLFIGQNKVSTDPEMLLIDTFNYQKLPTNSSGNFNVTEMNKDGSKSLAGNNQIYDQELRFFGNLGNALSSRNIERLSQVRDVAWVMQLDYQEPYNLMLREVDISQRTTGDFTQLRVFDLSDVTGNMEWPYMQYEITPDDKNLILLVPNQIIIRSLVEQNPAQ